MEEVFQEDFKPIQAVLVFEQNYKYKSEYYLESRRIELTNKGYQMKEGTPLSKKTLSKIMDNIETSSLDKIVCNSIFPKNLLYYQIKNLEPHIIWYVESRPQHLLFSKSLNIKDGIVNLPTLVFKLEEKELSVFAVKTNAPNGNTQLYKAPFHNVYDGGNICMGNAKAKKSNEIVEIMENYQNAFFNSKFSHLHGSGSPIYGNLNTYLSKLIKTGDKFNKNLLKKSKTDYINDLI